ncbi:hypothetical protein FLL45_00855 [Aliikangiella marina]|uniref:carnosine N-methyltransferase n=1 Tax=Aliikangiella marina TaxID=1712262 RepID=A0A545TH58_9GAMM|nr:hypothetical protein [Aliikangiella marina]TQV76545.1 hypothetical protein FLL45_00855 [Aliikangiella marina]
MNITPQFIDLMACPESGENLSLKDNQLVSQQSKCHYPVINGIPWLFRHPLHSMVDWSVKLNHFNQIFSDDIRQLKNELKKASDYTQPRLEKLLSGKTLFQQAVIELVSPILSAKVASKPVYDALSDRAPHTQNLLSYEANLYRDWVWGDEENKLSAKIIMQRIGTLQPKNVLVLGAGSCRLAYDIHRLLGSATTIANDINPLLLFAANKILSGEALEIVEFPAHPINTESVALSHSIAGLEKWPDNFYLLFSDAATPAIKSAAIDLVVTPWLIDIQPFELRKFMTCLNHYLPMGGHWVNFGSLVFNQSREALCYSIDEIKALAHEAGFEIEESESQVIPYLKSPHNAGYRMETVFSWRARKVKEVKQTESLQNLPNWILDINKPIPATREIQSFAFSHQLYAELAGKIDGKHSIVQIAKKIAREKSMDEQEAISMVKNFYLKIIQESF